MEDFFNYRRRKSSIVNIGNTPLGGDNPIRIQSMANVSTMDTDAAVCQAIRMIEAGAEYVRFTAQGEREARNLGVIRKQLSEAGYTTPLVADIHFNPRAADAAAEEVEKVRINPGNYVDKVKTFDLQEYTDEEYAAELQKIRDRFIPFLNICKAHGTAIRIGVNHGSLSDRIMSRYGDTPEGMVASCMEFLRICRDENFPDVVISIKASNTVVMVKTVRLLVRTMEAEDMYYPLHLGVTEAGDGEDGRIKSAVGIGALLSDGIGDTIRVSLSEDPEAEIPVARKLVDYILEREGHEPVETSPAPGYRLLVDAHFWKERPNAYPFFIASEIDELKDYSVPLKFIRLTYRDLTDRVIEVLKQDKSVIVILSTHHRNGIAAERAAMHHLLAAGCDVPVILHRDYRETDIEALQLKAAIDFGTLLLDGFGDGIMLHNEGSETMVTDSCMFGILQATRTRISKTEYISCPSCGRTLYDLQTTIARIKKATSHLKGLKIGIMGCIVNGPGEMADADYGYVGAGKNRISLYKGKECVLKNIPEEEAVERLVQLIKESGDWTDH